MAESDIQKTIIEYLKLKRHFFWRNNSGALPTKTGGFIRFGEAGSPDICLVKDGFFIGLEVKQKAGKQSPAQKEWEKAVKEAGGEYHVVRSLEDVMEIGL